MLIERTVLPGATEEVGRFALESEMAKQTNK